MMPVAMFLIEIAAWGRTPPGWVRYRAGERCSGHLSVALAESKRLNTRTTNARKHAAVFRGTDFRKHGASKNQILVIVPWTYDLETDGKGRPPEQKDFQALAYWTS